MEDEEVERTKCHVCIASCKKVTTFTLSHVGLLTLVVCYCLIGAAIFEALESDNEKKVKMNIIKLRETVAHELWNNTQTLSVIVPELWSKEALKKLKQFEDQLFDAMKKDGWDGTDDSTIHSWNTLGALFYSIIVITTIGYGHIAPKTTWGRIITIFYAIIGIPLMVVCWSHIGDFMANSFRVIYWKACCYICTRNPIPSERSTVSSARSSRRIRGAVGTSGSVRMKSRSIRRSARISQRSADSALSGDSVHSVASDPGFLHVRTGGSLRSDHHHSAHAPQRNHPHWSTLPRTSQPRAAGPPWRQRAARSEEPETSAGAKNLPVLFNRYAEDTFAEPPPGLETTLEFSGEEDDDDEIQSRRPHLTRSRARPRHQQEHGSHQSRSSRYLPPPEELNYWEDEEDFEEAGYEDERYERRPVPIWLCALLVISYIIGGAFLFKHWESWSMLDSAYFCFITLTTIGFGDFVPELRSRTNPEVSIALCSIYLLFGIALLAMSFNLVQEQVVNAFKDLAMRLGIISEDDEERE